MELDFDWAFVYALWSNNFATRAKTYTIQTASSGARILYWTMEKYPGKPFADSLRLEYHGNNQYVILWGWAKNRLNERGDYKVFNDTPILVDDAILKDSTIYLKELLAGRYRFLLYPCVKEYLKKCKKNLCLDHNKSLAINYWMIKFGCTDEEIHNFRRLVVDFDKLNPKQIVQIYNKSVTTSQIKNGRAYLEKGGRQRSCFSRQEGKPSVCEVFEYDSSGCGGCPWRIENKVGTMKQYQPLSFFDVNEKTGRSTFIPKRLATVIKEETRLASLGRNLPIMFYDEGKGVWVDQGERIIRNRAYELLDELGTHSRVEEVVHYIEDTTYMDISIFDSDPTRLPVCNGALNLITGQLEDHTPDLYAITYLPRVYDETKDNPNFKKFLAQIIEPDDIPTLQEWYGYHLWREYHIRAALLLLGGGGNGKSTLLRHLCTFLGRKNVANHNLQEIIHDRFAKADLFGKLGNISADISSKELTDTGKFKEATGNDPISAQKKFQNTFSFINTAKLSFSANQIPMSSDLTEAFFERWLPVTCPHKFINGVNANPNISKELHTEDELSGTLNWTLEGLKRLLKNGCFSNSKTAAEVQTLWEESSDSINAFSKCISQSSTGEITKGDLYYAYCSFCASRKFVAEGVIAFGRSIQHKLDFKVADSQITIEKRKPALRGLILNCGWCVDFVDSENSEGCKGCKGTYYWEKLREKSHQVKLVETTIASHVSHAIGTPETPPEGPH